MADREALARRLSTAVSVAISEALATQEQTQQIPVRTFFYFAFLIALYQERKKLCAPKTSSTFVWDASQGPL